AGLAQSPRNARRGSASDFPPGAPARAALRPASARPPREGTPRRPDPRVIGAGRTRCERAAIVVHRRRDNPPGGGRAPALLRPTPPASRPPAVAGSRLPGRVGLGPASTPAARRNRPAT